MASATGLRWDRVAQAREPERNFRFTDRTRDHFVSGRQRTGPSKRNRTIVGWDGSSHRTSLRWHCRWDSGPCDRTPIVLGRTRSLLIKTTADQTSKVLGTASSWSGLNGSDPQKLHPDDLGVNFHTAELGDGLNRLARCHKIVSRLPQTARGFFVQIRRRRGKRCSTAEPAETRSRDAGRSPVALRPGPRPVGGGAARPRAWSKELRQSGLTDDEIYSLIVPRRTLTHRRARREALSRDESDRAVRLARIAALAEQVFGDRERWWHWLGAEKRQFEGRSPLQLMVDRSRRAPRRGAVVPHRRGHGRVGVSLADQQPPIPCG